MKLKEIKGNEIHFTEDEREVLRHASIILEDLEALLRVDGLNQRFYEDMANIEKSNGKKFSLVIDYLLRLESTFIPDEEEEEEG